jgi:hypothetical protein
MYCRTAKPQWAVLTGTNLLRRLQEDLPPGTLQMNAGALMEPEFVPEAALQHWLDSTLDQYQ